MSDIDEGDRDGDRAYGGEPVSSKKDKPVRWTLESAVEFIRDLEPILASLGWHCALTGSVLYKGESRKDLDLVVYPHRTSNHSLAYLRQGLRRAGLELFMDANKVKVQWSKLANSEDRKRVELWFQGARRVDVFVLS